MKTFSVTQEDIDHGARLDGGYNCPVALCIRRAGYSEVRVLPLTISLSHPVGRLGVITRKLRTPIRVTRFIRRFDSGKPVKPFNFRLLI